MCRSRVHFAVAAARRSCHRGTARGHDGDLNAQPWARPSALVPGALLAGAASRGHLAAHRLLGFLLGLAHDIADGLRPLLVRFARLGFPGLTLGSLRTTISKSTWDVLHAGEINARRRRSFQAALHAARPQ